MKSTKNEFFYFPTVFSFRYMPYIDLYKQNKYKIMENASAVLEL